VRSARPSAAVRAKYWNASQNILVTRTLIAINIVVFVWTVAGNREYDLGLSRVYIENGEWYRVISSGFLHFGLIHVGMNMLLLWQLGQLLEPAMGRTRFTALYFIAMVGGAIGALLVEPNGLTGGASGAVFGLMAAAAVGLKQRGINPMQTGIGSTLILNLLITFAIPGISIGGHIGGALTGAAIGYLLLKPRWR
jgi:membrane associated rhomboid family serine protease